MNRCILAFGIAGALVGCGAGSADGNAGFTDGTGGTGAGAASGSGGDGLVFGTAGADGTAGGLNGVMGRNDQLGCNTITNRGEQIPLDMYIMFDQSLSMSCAIPSGGDRWTAVKGALSNFVNDPSAAGIEVGIQYFGEGIFSSCDPVTYQSPDVEIGMLPGNAGAIVNSLNGHNPVSNTPTAAGLSGALNHAIEWRNGHPGNKVIVVLVTDGQPNACGAVGDVANVAGAGLNGAGLNTYVIGITNAGASCALDPAPPNVSDLDFVAQAGGTAPALIVESTQNPAQAFLDKMNQIRGSAQIPCQYTIPSNDSSFDASKVNVEYVDGANNKSTVYGVGAQGACDPSKGDGWYYDDPNAPKAILLCPSTCNTVTSQTGLTLNVVLGCPTEPPPT